MTDADMVPATTPLRRFDPGLVAWHGVPISMRKDTAWMIEALHLNDGRRLYVSDLVGDVQSRSTRQHYAAVRARKDGASGTGPKAAAAKAPTRAAAGAARSGRNSGSDDRRGLHAQRTCRYLVAKGLAEWPDAAFDGDGDAVGYGTGGGTCAAAGAAGAPAEMETTVEVILPGGAVHTVKRVGPRHIRPSSPRGRAPAVMLPRLTPAGRIVWMQTRLGLSSKDTIVLALAWSRFRQAGYFVKSHDLVHDNVWMTDSMIRTAWYNLGRAGYVAGGKNTGQITHIRKARKIEPYGPMLEVIEEMVYGARAGEYVYGDAYDDEINRAYAETVAALGENAEPTRDNDGDATKQ